MVLQPPGPVSTYPVEHLASAGPRPVLEAAAVSVVIVSYEGEKNSAGLCHGQGTANFIDGHSYTGEWEAGYMHGQGKYTWVDGPTFEGSFVMNKIEGQGVYMWPGSGKYEGEVHEGKRHGQGVLTFELDAAVYEGQWMNGLRHGQGKLTFNTEGTCYYEGGWVNDCKSGQGKMVYANGNVYEGKWLKNHKNGQGKMMWSQTGEVFTGEWLNGYPNGLGEHIWFGASLVPNKSNKAQYLMYNRYVGQFVQGRREGEGTFYYSTGARYEGQWLHSKKHGEGIYIFEDGTVFVGSFENDMPLGVMPERFGPVEPGPKVYVEDLLVEEPNSGDAYHAVLKMLLCHNSELRGIYDTYCSIPLPEVEGLTQQTGTAMLSGQAWKFILDCNIPSRQLSFATCCETLLRACQAPPAVMKRRRKFRTSKTASAYLAKNAEEAFSPTYTILFREFCEAIVRIAQLKYHVFPNLERRVHKLINDDILPLAKRPAKKLTKPSSGRIPGMGSRSAKSKEAQLPPPPPPKPTISDLVASETMRNHLHEMDTVISTLYNIALQGGIPAFLEYEEQREEHERLANMPTHRHMSSFRGRKSTSMAAREAFSRNPKLSRSITIRGCLRVLHDCGLLEPRKEEPKAETPEEGEDTAEPADPSSSPEKAVPEPEGGGEGEGEAKDPVAEIPPPPADSTFKITMESAYAALIEAVIPAGSSLEPPAPTSRPASPPKMMTPPGSAMPPSSPLPMSAVGEQLVAEPSSGMPTEQPVEIWMLEYTVMYTQFVEFLARCADRGDPTERFPLHVKLWMFLRKIYNDVISQLKVAATVKPKFLENAQVQGLIDTVKRTEREAYEAAVRAQLETPQSGTTGDASTEEQNG